VGHRLPQLHEPHPPRGTDARSNIWALLGIERPDLRSRSAEQRVPGCLRAPQLVVDARILGDAGGW
jgi:hypothetical protein